MPPVLVRLLGGVLLLGGLLLDPQLALAAEWVLPLSGAPVVTRPFEPPPTPYGRGHRGVDLAGAPDEPVRAAGAGTIGYAAPLAGRGVVTVLHDGGLRTTYEPVTATIGVGETVRAGDPIGLLQAGHPGCPVPACLHWGLRQGEVYLDPMSLLRPGPIRLLPSAGSPGPPATTGEVPRGGPALVPRSVRDDEVADTGPTPELPAPAAAALAALAIGATFTVRVRSAGGGAVRGGAVLGEAAMRRQPP